MSRVESIKKVPSQENSSSKNIPSDQECQPELVKAEEQPYSKAKSQTPTALHNPELIYPLSQFARIPLYYFYCPN